MMSTNQQINSLICKKDDNEFIYYQLTYNMEKIKNRASVAIVPIINKSEFGLNKIADAFQKRAEHLFKKA